MKDKSIRCGLDVLVVLSEYNVLGSFYSLDGKFKMVFHLEFPNNCPVSKTWDLNMAIYNVDEPTIERPLPNSAGKTGVTFIVNLVQFLFT